MEHYWLDLPGPNWFSGADVYRRYVESVRGPSVAVELGAWKGRSTSFMAVEIANSGKPITFHTVDHWRGSEGEVDYDSDPDLQSGTLFDAFMRNIGPVVDHVNVIRSESAAAAERFAEESVDFLYVDASHSYEGALKDIVAWYPKVKPGGLIAGDDWCHSMFGETGVQNAVLDFFGPSRASVVVESGSAPNPDWLQWSIVKAPGQAVSSSAELSLRRIRRAAARSLPARAVRAAVRRLSPTPA